MLTSLHLWPSNSTSMKTSVALPVPWDPSEINLEDIFMSNNLLAA